jgi:hypothetical protein
MLEDSRAGMRSIIQLMTWN